MPRVHLLKCWPESFRAVVAGTKTYEVRKDDRGYMVGDYLRLDEWEPGGVAWHSSIDGWLSGNKASLTGEHQWVRVTYKTPGGSWGLPTDLCILGFEKCDAPSRGGS